MSHPNPQHDPTNVYPEDGYTPATKSMVEELEDLLQKYNDGKILPPREFYEKHGHL
jgi:hypothetical protein